MRDEVLSIDMSIYRKLGCRPAIVYEFIRKKNFEDRGESKITYADFFKFLNTKADKSITEAIKKLESAGLLRVRRTNRGNYYKARSLK